MLYCKDEILGIIFVDHKCCLWSRIGTVKSRAVDQTGLLFNFGNFWPKVTVHKHKISPS